MEVLRARGNVNEALRVYEDIRVLLREELGSSPGAALVALHEQLLRDDPRRRARPAAAAARAPSRARRWSSATARSRCWTRCCEEASEGEGRAVLIEGPPGIGKSRLMAEFRRRAIADGALVLNARAGELEREFPFGVVRQLFEAVVADPDALAGAAAAARVVFAAPDDGAPTGGDASFAALHGLYWLALNLAAERPLLLEVDDLHWCDRPSLRFLAYLVRRLEGQPVLVTASVRTGDPPTDAALLAEIANDPATAHVRPGPLSEEAVGALVARRLGAEPDARVPRGLPHAPPAATRCSSASCSTRWRPTRVKPDAAHADVVRAIGSRAVSSSVLLRLARLPGEASAVARAVAVLGEGADLPAVAGVAGLDEAQVAGHDGRARARRDPAPRAAARLRAPARPRRRLPGPAARRARAAARARRRRAAADRAPRWTRSPASSCTRRGAATPRSRALLHEAGIAAMARGAIDNSVGYLRRALDEPRAGRRSARSCCSTSARSRR